MRSPRGIIACALLTLLFSHFGCQSDTVNDLPGELVGTWRTAAPGYGDRYLTFTPGSVIFGTGESTYNTYAIVDVKKQREKSRTLYTVYHKEPAGEHYGENYKLSFYYDTDDGGLITFKNQAHLIWARDRG